jgi:phage tail-like protein
VAEGSELVQTFRFKVTLTRSNPGEGPATLGDGGFSECSGLGLEADVKEYLEGGRNDGVVRRVGRVKLVPLVLKRGMFLPGEESGADGTADRALWDWITAMVSGTLPVPRYDGEVEVQDPSGERVVARWAFDRALPLKVTGPTLNAKTGEVAIEELHLAHEGLRLAAPQ